MNLVKKLTGYKATDKDMKCLDHQFVLNEWYETEGDLVLCENGFHFCEQPSGPWCYYGEEGTRIFKVEAEEVVRSSEPGADAKCVARRIRLVEEIFPDGDGNTGDRNTGDGNTGYLNTGDRNTGDCNTGDRNTGDCNTGDCNTGYQNTGYQNTGNLNTGDQNTGDCNTGNRNTGDQNTGDQNTGDQNTGGWNTGYRNTGSRNTGDGNACDGQMRHLCFDEATVVCFNVDSMISRKEFDNKFLHNVNCLSYELAQDEEIDFKKYEDLPGCTPEKLKKLHEKHMEARDA